MPANAAFTEFRLLREEAEQKGDSVFMYRGKKYRHQRAKSGGLMVWKRSGKKSSPRKKKRSRR